MISRLLPFLAAALLAAGPAYADIMLRHNVVVTGSVVHLGDFFSDVGAQAAEPVGSAPALGMRVTYDANWLAALAREHHLNWSPASSYDQVTAERASRTIDADTIAAQLLKLVTARDPTAQAELQLDNPGLRLVVPAEAPDTVAVDGLTIDPHSGRLSAFISAQSSDTAAPRQRVNAQVIYETEVPVLNRAVATGEVIAARDIGEMKVRRDRIGTDIATDPVQLIGKSARYGLAAQRPLRVVDVQEPVVIHKGALVTITLETPVMQLTTQGKSLDDGTMGTMIRVENTKSNRIIDAQVAGPDRVTVGGPARLAAR